MQSVDPAIRTLAVDPEHNVGPLQLLKTNGLIHPAGLKSVHSKRTAMELVPVIEGKYVAPVHCGDERA